MTRNLKTCTLCLASLAAFGLSTQVFAADSPHSRSSIGSIFTEMAGPGGASPAVRPGENENAPKAVSLNQVVEFLREAGLEAAVEGENAANVKLQHSRWTFPVAISLDADKEKVRLEMLLTELEGKPSLSPERLLGLLGTNIDFQPAFFSFSNKRNRIELVASLAYSQVSAESLKDELNKLAAISESTASLWEITADSTSTAPASPGNVAATPPAASAPADSGINALVGKWSAARSASEAFAMQLKADGTFVLVFVKDGKQSRSTGKFTVGGGQLTLTTSDGGKFAGGISNANSRSFEFLPQGGKASKLTFQRAS